MIELSQEQKKVSDGVVEWIRFSDDKLLTVGGFAGVGKTTVVAAMRDSISDLRVAFCTLTGRATSISRQKLYSMSTLFREPYDYCGTIHGLIYEPPLVDPRTQRILWKRREDIEANLIILDEASMVSKGIYDDLSSFGIRILAVGDHFQLPPVDKSSGFNLMKSPDLRLETIHRQAENDPIIHASMLIRNNGKLDYGVYGENVQKVKSNDDSVDSFVDASGDFSDTIILCGLNNTRVKLNKHIRINKFNRKTKYPVVGDRVMCLRNSYHSLCPIFNGELGTVSYSSVDKKGGYVELDVNVDGRQDLFHGYADSKVFGEAKPEVDYKKMVKVKAHGAFRYLPKDYFDYGYALTVHKSQGSQADRVMIFEEGMWTGEERARWLYTGVTRAVKELLVVG